MTRRGLRARELTLPGRHPYADYSRFFQDLAIAFLAYGALYRAVHGSLSAVVYLAVIVALRMLWAIDALREHPNNFRLNFHLIAGSHTAPSWMPAASLA